jgi:hypothetical protein
VPLAQRELVDGDRAPPRQVGHRPQPARQGGAVDRPHRFPAQPEVGGDLRGREHRGQPGDALGEARHHARVAPEPGERLDGGAAARAGDAGERDEEPGLGVEDRQLAHAADADVVDGRRRAAAAAAVAARVRRGGQLDGDPRRAGGGAAGLAGDGGDGEARPAAEQGGDVLVRHGGASG